MIEANMKVMAPQDFSKLTRSLCVRAGVAQKHMACACRSRRDHDGYNSGIVRGSQQETRAKRRNIMGCQEYIIAKSAIIKASDALPQ
jgi:hypothetical protein